MRPPIEFTAPPPPPNPLFLLKLVSPPSRLGSRPAPPSPSRMTRAQSSAALSLKATPHHRAATKSVPIPPAPIESRPTTAAEARIARKGCARVDWDLTNGEGKWLLDLRYSSRHHASSQPCLGSHLTSGSRLLQTTVASQMQGAASLLAAREIPYANALERWQNDLRCRKGSKHAYSNYAHDRVVDDGLTNEFFGWP